MEALWAEQALTGEGWRRDVRVEIARDGRIAAIEPDTPAQGRRVGILLPAPANLHSHAFQRAMAGLTEQRGPDPRDSFWTWRRLMYRFLERIGPDELESIAAFAQMQMLEAGFASVAEFHYVHHQAGGTPYHHLAELSNRIAAAASETGIGLTLLPVLYRHGGCGGSRCNRHSFASGIPRTDLRGSWRRRARRCARSVPMHARGWRFIR